jgi:hypothetical protein
MAQGRPNDELTIRSMQIKTLANTTDQQSSRAAQKADIPEGPLPQLVFCRHLVRVHLFPMRPNVLSETYPNTHKSPARLWR